MRRAEVGGLCPVFDAKVTPKKSLVARTKKYLSVVGVVVRGKASTPAFEKMLSGAKILT
jgi:hypothetical protein